MFPDHVGLVVVDVTAGDHAALHVRTHLLAIHVAVFVRIADASGIAKQSLVRVAGIGVGRIESIRLEGGRARIDMKIRPDVALYDDAAVQKATASLLGEYYIAITPGTEGRRQLGEGDEIRNLVQQPSTDEILRQVSNIAEKIGRVAESLANSIGTEEGQANMRTTLQNLAEVTKELNETVKENRGSIHNILSQVETITGAWGKWRR